MDAPTLGAKAPTGSRPPRRGFSPSAVARHIIGEESRWGFAPSSEGLSCGCGEARIPHQQLSAALEDKLAFTATLAGSYEQAGLLAKKWGCEVDGSVIHA